MRPTAPSCRQHPGRLDIRRAGLTVTAFAAQVGLSRAAVVAWLSGRSGLSVGSAARIAGALGATVDDVVRWRPEGTGP